jgi:hypothetical protein
VPACPRYRKDPSFTTPNLITCRDQKFTGRARIEYETGNDPSRVAGVLQRNPAEMTHPAPTWGSPPIIGPTTGQRTSGTHCIFDTRRIVVTDGKIPPRLLPGLSLYLFCFCNKIKSFQCLSRCHRIVASDFKKWVICPQGSMGYNPAVQRRRTRARYVEKDCDCRCGLGFVGAGLC